MGFFEGGLMRLASSVLTKDSPLYVQYYVTARCNLTCEQCNVIYANADQEECTTEQASRIAENLARIGTSIVLLTGGEPFVRKDIVDIAKAFRSQGVHPRLQTNGLASREALERMAAAGMHDLSISLDSVVPQVQDAINGGFDRSWERALRAIATVNDVFPERSFCALGCVLSPRNAKHVRAVIKFATRIGWWVSLVPAHHTTVGRPRSFSTFDPALRFTPEQYPEVAEALADVKALRDSGHNVYDSDEYLDDIYRFVTGQPILWRRRNGGRCDSPNLYFAIQPNGDMAACCDYRLPTRYPVYAPEFPAMYRDPALRGEVDGITSACGGCMYGSFPEITITARYFEAMVSRAKLFLTSGTHRRLERMPAEQMMELALHIGREEGLL